MAKTLREAAEEVRDAEAEVIPYSEFHQKRLAFARAKGGTYDYVPILAALDAERAAVLEEVRAWLEERAGELERQLAADHHDSHKHGGVDEVRVLTYRFTRRFLAGKEGA